MITLAAEHLNFQVTKVSYFDAVEGLVLVLETLIFILQTDPDHVGANFLILHLFRFEKRTKLGKELEYYVDPRIEMHKENPFERVWSHSLLPCFI